VVIGGLLSYVVHVRLTKMYPKGEIVEAENIAVHRHRGLLLACGIVAGASLMGVLLAFPFALKQSSDALKIMPDQYMSFAGVLSILVTFVLCGWMYKVVLKKD